MDFGENMADLLSGVVTAVMAVVLLCLRIPRTRQWHPLLWMTRLLAASYLVLSAANLFTGTYSHDEVGSTPHRCIVIFVAMYQAFLFTATCVSFVEPKKLTARRILINAAAITAVGCILVGAICSDFRYLDALFVVAAVAYACQLGLYLNSFSVSYRRCRTALEENYDEELSGRLRWISRCFYSALAIGLSALAVAAFPTGRLGYCIFTVIFTAYYVYVVICVINYRVSASFIVKVVACNNKPAKAAPTDDTASDREDALRLALDRWVADRRYTATDLTVEEIASELGTTQSELARYFTNRLGTTFRTWRIGLRIAEAKRLLREEDAPTASLHEMVGVADKSNFHKQFRQVTGLTPKEYKRKLTEVSDGTSPCGCR